MSLKLEFTCLKLTKNICTKGATTKTSTLDCGVFAIANAVEFCFTGYPELGQQKRDWDFDNYCMRDHLLDCLNNEEFRQFPKIVKEETEMATDIFNITISCPCGLANLTGNVMICCDRCQKWYHEECADDNAKTQTTWLCHLCKNKRLRRVPKK